MHLWPRGRLAKEIGIAMTVFNFLLFSSFLAWVIASPETFSILRAEEQTHQFYKDWASEQARRLQTCSISCLLVGFPTSLLTICFLLFQDKFVKKVVDKQEEDVGDQLHKEKDPANKECDVKTEENDVQIEMEDDIQFDHSDLREVDEEEEEKVEDMEKVKKKED